MMEEVIWAGPVFMAIIVMGIHLLANKCLSVNTDINDAKIVKMFNYFKSKRFVYVNLKVGLILFLVGLCAYMYANYSGLCTVPQEEFCRSIESVILMFVTFVLGTWMGGVIAVQSLVKQDDGEEKE